MTNRIRYAATRAASVASQPGQWLRAHRPTGRTAIVSTRANTAGATIPADALMPTPIATTPAMPSRTTIERGNVLAVAPPTSWAERDPSAGTKGMESR